jgi:methionyl-tRNA formyltransferase
LRAIFMGTPSFAVPSLDALADIAEVVGVVCQPDKPQGRSMQLTPPPVKVRALERGLRVFAPTKVRDGSLLRWIEERQPDVALVVAYGRILPPAVLAAPRVGCINVHASLLPKYRGAAPITWAIARGEQETGVGLMQMEEGLDTGPVYAEARTAIDPNETAGQLGERLSHVAAELVRTKLPLVVAGALQPRAQRHDEATLAPILKKEDGAIDWTRTARAIHDHVRAMQPWPTAFTKAHGHSLKVLRTRVDTAFTSSDAARSAGTVLIADKHGIVVACGADGRETISILDAQPEGKRAQTAADLVNGRAIAVGERLG